MSLRRRMLMAGGGTGSFPTSDPATRLLHALFNGSADGATYAIGAATRTAGTWATYVSNPVISAGSGWEASTVKDPCLLWDGSQYVCYYSGLGASGYQIGRATTSAHTGSWSKYGSNPVLTVGAGGAFDDAGVNFPTVFYEPSDTGKEWKMWYGANDGSVQSIGYAHSSDGLSWTKVGQVLTKGSSGTWEDEGVLPMAIVKSGSTYHLFYGGRQGTTNPRWQGGVATFTDPEGTYTKYAGNPTLLARFNDSGTSVALTGTNSASATVTVSATGGFNVLEPVYLADANSESELQRIASIDSGVQVTLATPSTGSFTVAQGAVLRSAAYNAVLHRSVLPYGAMWETYGTPFQPLEDITPGGTKLREMSERWTAASLTGSWSYDHATGVLFPLYPANTGWDKFSAENPSVIVAP